MLARCYGTQIDLDVHYILLLFICNLMFSLLEMVKIGVSCAFSGSLYSNQLQDCCSSDHPYMTSYNMCDQLKYELLMLVCHMLLRSRKHHNTRSIYIFSCLAYSWAPITKVR